MTAATYGGVTAVFEVCLALGAVGGGWSENSLTSNYWGDTARRRRRCHWLMYDMYVGQVLSWMLWCFASKVKASGSSLPWSGWLLLSTPTSSSSSLTASACWEDVTAGPVKPIRPRPPDITTQTLPVRLKHIAAAASNNPQRHFSSRSAR